MITETGRIVAIENDSLWVQTVRKSACAQCSARKGCGQAVLAQLGREPGYLKVSLNGQASQNYQVNQYVEIGMAEQVIVKSTLLIYLMPLLIMMFAIAASATFTQSEPWALVCGVVGLGVGALMARTFLAMDPGKSALEPTLIGSVPGTKTVVQAVPQ